MLADILERDCWVDFGSERLCALKSFLFEVRVGKLANCFNYFCASLRFCMTSIVEVWHIAYVGLPASISKRCQNL